MDRRQTGTLAENSAAAFLESQGFRSWRAISCAASANRRGGARRRLLVIAEVRTRADDRFGGAAASVNHGKQRRIIMTASLFLHRHPELRRCRVRFDVIVVRDGEVEWLKHAFNS